MMRFGKNLVIFSNMMPNGAVGMFTVPEDTATTEKKMSELSTDNFFDQEQARQNAKNYPGGVKFLHSGNSVLQKPLHAVTELPVLSSAVGENVQSNEEKDNEKALQTLNNKKYAEGKSPSGNKKGVTIFKVDKNNPSPKNKSENKTALGKGLGNIHNEPISHCELEGRKVVITNPPANKKIWKGKQGVIKAQCPKTKKYYVEIVNTSIRIALVLHEECQLLH